MPPGSRAASRRSSDRRGLAQSPTSTPFTAKRRGNGSASGRSEAKRTRWPRAASPSAISRIEFSAPPTRLLRNGDCSEKNRMFIASGVRVRVGRRPAARRIEADPNGLAKPPDRGGARMSGGPIFILGIQRGGTNQILNILRSHPATSWPQGEFHEVFRPRGLRAREGPGACRQDSAATRRSTSPPATSSTPTGRRARERAARRGARPRGRAPGSTARAAANRASVAAYKAALRAQGFFAADAPPPERLLVKVLNYNLVFVPDLHAL